MLERRELRYIVRPYNITLDFWIGEADYQVANERGSMRHTKIITSKCENAKAAKAEVLQYLGLLEDDMKNEHGLEFFEITDMDGNRSTGLYAGQNEFRIRPLYRRRDGPHIAMVRERGEHRHGDWRDLSGNEGKPTEYPDSDAAVGAVVAYVLAQRKDSHDPESQALTIPEVVDIPFALAVPATVDATAALALTVEEQVSTVRTAAAEYKAAEVGVVRSAIAVGRELTILKAMVRHGEWTALFESEAQNYGLTTRRLTHFMRMADYDQEHPGELRDFASVNQAIERIKESQNSFQAPWDSVLPALTDSSAMPFLTAYAPDDQDDEDGEDWDDGDDEEYAPAYNTAVMEPQAPYMQERELVEPPTYRVLDAIPAAPPVPEETAAPDIQAETPPEDAQEPAAPAADDDEMPLAVKLECSLDDLMMMLGEAQKSMGSNLDIQMVTACNANLAGAWEKRILDAFTTVQQRGFVDREGGLLIVPNWASMGHFLDFGFDTQEYFEGIYPVLLDLTPGETAARSATADGWLYIGVYGPHCAPLHPYDDLTGFSGWAEAATGEELAAWLKAHLWQQERA